MKVLEDGRFESRSEIILPESDVLELLKIEIFTQNLEYSTESAFQVYVTEDYLRDQASMVGISAGTVLALLTVGFIVLCGVSILIFVKVRREQAIEGAKLSETEERYMALVQLRRAIKKAERNSVDPDQDPLLVGRLKKELADLKAKHLVEFLDVLDEIEIEGNEHGAFDIEDCMICMEKLTSNQKMYQIPVCKHVFHSECTKSWFDSKNQESEQRCPLCNTMLDITILRELKTSQQKEAETQGD